MQSTKETKSNRNRSFLARALYFSGWFTALLLTISVLLLINNAVTYSALATIPNDSESVLKNEKVAQAVLLLVPVLLIFIQLRICDLVADRFRQRRK